MMIFLFLAIFLFVGYNVFAVSKFGVPNSLSATYYHLQQRYSCGLVFSAMLALVSIISMVVALEVTAGKWYQFLAFLTTIGTVFVAFSPRFKALEHTRVHSVSAVLSIASALLLMAFMGYFRLALIPLMAFGIHTVIRKPIFREKRVYITEIAVFLSIFIVLILEMSKCGI